MDLQDHGRAAVRQRSGVADKLDGVPETLLSRQQDRVSAEWKFAKPKPAAIAMTWIGHAAAFPAPLVFPEAAAQIADCQEGQRPIEVGVRIVLIDSNRLVETRDRVRVAIENLQGPATIIPGFDVLWCALQHTIEDVERFGGTVEIEQRIAAIVQSLTMVWRLRKGCIEICERFFGTIEGSEHSAAVDKSVASAGIARQDSVEASERFAGSAERGKCASTIELRLEVVRPQSKRLVQTIERFAIALEGMKHVGEIHKGVRCVRFVF